MTWGPWIKHDGTGCPLPVGTLVMVRFEVAPDDFRQREIFVKGGLSWDWTWWLNEHPHALARVARIVAYRLPRSAAFDLLRTIAECRDDAGIEGGEHDRRRVKEGAS